MFTITRKRFLQLLLLLPVVAPVLSLPLGLLPALSFVPFVLGFLIKEGWIFYLPFCIVVVLLTEVIKSTRKIIWLYIFSPFVFLMVFYLGINLLKYVNLYERYFNYNFGSMYGTFFIIILVCYFYVGLGKFLYDLFLESKYLKNQDVAAMRPTIGRYDV